MIVLAAAAYQWWVPVALAASVVAWTGLCAWAATHWIPADWRPGGEEEW